MSSPVSFDLSAAVNGNRFWSSRRRQVKHGPKRLVWQGQGWGPIYGAIAAWVFGEYDPPPSEERFAHLVARWQREQSGLAVNGILGRASWRRMQEQIALGLPPGFTSPVNRVARPHGLEQTIASFGDPRSMDRSTWEARYIGAARAPGTRRFLRQDGSNKQVVYLHRSLVPHAEAFFATVASGGLWDELQPIGRGYQWDPDGNSLHAWGLALDICPDRYPSSHRPRDYPGPGSYPPGYLVRHLQAFGWQWGLWSEVPQPGHLQFATGIEGC